MSEPAVDAGLGLAPSDARQRQAVVAGPAAPAGTADRLRGAAQRWRLALVLMAGSGFAGLGYQIVWAQQFSLWLGHETASVLAVVAGFFGGLAAGALLLAPRVERSLQPQRWYAGCEAAIGIWSLILALAMTPASIGLLAWSGAQPSPVWQWSMAFIGSFLLLLPASLPMGATLPALQRVVASQGRSVAGLYAANTAGALSGVLLSAFWLLPTFGLLRTALVCAALNLLCALAALGLRPDGATPAAVPQAPATGRLRLQLFATGLLGIGYEVLVVRVLSQVAENTVYTFAMLLAVYLLGTAAGAAAWQRWSGRVVVDGACTDRLLWCLSGACLLGTASLWSAAWVKTGVLQWLGPSLFAALSAEALLALLAFLLPTIVMGALFSHLAALAAAAKGLGLGRAFGLNTLGAAAAPLVFGVLALPAVGSKLALSSLAAAYLLLQARWTPVPLALAGVAAAVAVLAPPLRWVEVPPGGHLAWYREGSLAAVSVVEDAAGVSRLHINNRQQEGSSNSFVADARQALLPLLLHPAPRRALFLGLGTGVTATAAAADPGLQVDAVELLPEVIAASALFTGDADRRPTLMAADARRFVRAGGPAYDLVVADNFHPARSGSGSLYTVEHFHAVRARLAAGGLFFQWLPLHQLDRDTLRSIVAAFVAEFPGGFALLASNSLETPVLGLVGSADGRRFAWPAVQARVAGAAPALRSAEVGLGDAWSVLGSFVAGPAALARLAAGAPVNTDDHPVVSYLAPRITYAPDSLPRDRLVELLGELGVSPSELVEPGADEARLAAYWRARDMFLNAGRRVRPLADVRRMLDQVQQPLLEVLRTSPDFRPAYDPLLRMAGALTRSDLNDARSDLNDARSDVDAARALLSQLARLQPARPEAVLALQELAAERR